MDNNENSWKIFEEEKNSSIDITTFKQKTELAYYNLSVYNQTQVVFWDKTGKILRIGASCDEGCSSECSKAIWRINQVPHNDSNSPTVTLNVKEQEEKTLVVDFSKIEAPQPFFTLVELSDPGFKKDKMAYQFVLNSKKGDTSFTILIKSPIDSTEYFWHINKDSNLHPVELHPTMQDGFTLKETSCDIMPTELSFNEPTGNQLFYALSLLLASYLCIHLLLKSQN